MTGNVELSTSSIGVGSLPRMLTGDVHKWMYTVSASRLLVFAGGKRLVFQPLSEQGVSGKLVGEEKANDAPVTLAIENGH